MAGRFTKIPQSTFNDLQTDAGMVVKNLNPTNPNVQDSDIVTATTGGITIAATPTFEDFGADVDNCPNNLKELKRITGWDVSMSFTALGSDADTIKLSLGAADIDPQNSNKVIPRATLKNADFSDLWWIGDKADGGYLACRVINALSTGGFSLKTTKNGKGNITVTITGHVSIAAQDVVPIEFYSYSGSDIDFYTVTQTLANVNSTFTDNTVDSGDSVTATLTAAEGYEIANVIVIMGGVDITSTAYNEGVVTIASVSGDVQIIATATAA